MCDEISRTENNKNNLDNIKELGVSKTSSMNQRFQILPIIGQIEGHSVLPPQSKSTKYEHLIPQLVSIETDSTVEGVLIILNTVGGDVEAGLAISEMINSLSKPTVSLVIGGSHSIGVPLATCSKYSFISPSATMIIHPIRMNGLVLGVPQTFEYFNKMQERIIEFIGRTSKVDKGVLRKLMLQTDELLNDMGTILIGKQAVDYGIIDEVGGLSDAIKKLDQMIDEVKKQN
ncbi:translocation-enhancing protein TepA [Clostridium homopropionicum DSM 5847]|uniref:Translocation-enhancing protein TepA n=1 Tax=Clostridium homopropionicum DSM 5847 TaxID=1121318 RepID=A0A0L6ZD28_9CLOT|nr:ATP-dependent Clp protease proteolytic subunit [Clostridium homopropionicum]KOA20886.1 translocation-enhancing protein TepA [Clostridium homopropionicum DSM 5847]SFG02894.1 ATP-dependent Clp protease proteolytic subunit ClpP [Clostridium homopropionicum]